MTTAQEHKERILGGSNFQVVVRNPAVSIMSHLLPDFEGALHSFQEELKAIPADAEQVIAHGKMAYHWHQATTSMYSNTHTKIGFVGLYERAGENWVLMARSRFTALMLGESSESSDTALSSEERQ